MEVDTGGVMKSAGEKQGRKYGMRKTLETQEKHAQAHSKQSHGAVAEGSACEYVPGRKKAAAAVESGSACEWTPGKKH